MTESSHPLPPFPRAFFDDVRAARPGFRQLTSCIIPLDERGKAFVVKKGQSLRITCIEGPQVVDLCLWNANDFDEYFWNEATLGREGIF
ncbi:DUF1989 domain-containing protein, partial [Chloroflexota bacterium]